MQQLRRQLLVRSNLRLYHDYIRANAAGHNIRVPLHAPTVTGVASSRGTRPHQEDCCTLATINVHPLQLQASIKKASGYDWNVSQLPEELASQVVFAGLYDGHGGPEVSKYLQTNLHSLFETVTPQLIPEAYEWIKSFGGYFRRFHGGALSEWIDNPNTSASFDLDARSTLAFLQADKSISNSIANWRKMGSTASVLLLNSLDHPSTPFFSARRVAITVAHCGDTRILLCSASTGLAHPLTEKHHADARGEAARLRRLGAALITDSYGESRWMGAVENTRGLGDGNFKRFGVTPEPELSTRILHAPEWAFIVLISDGVSSMLSDQEIVDITRQAKTPSEGASKIISFLEELGVEDNATAMTLPLAGWGNIAGPDRTKSLRLYKQNQAIGNERQRRM